MITRKQCKRNTRLQKYLSVLDVVTKQIVLRDTCKPTSLIKWACLLCTTGLFKVKLYSESRLSISEFSEYPFCIFRTLLSWGEYLATRPEISSKQLLVHSHLATPLETKQRRKLTSRILLIFLSTTWEEIFQILLVQENL